MKYRHIIQYVTSTPWAILPAKLGVILDALAFLAAGGEYSEAEIAAITGAAARPPAPVSSGVAVLPLVGTIAQRAGSLEASSGGVSTERFAQAFRQALSDPAVGAIVIDVDSPGGDVHGVDELSSEVFHARGQKPIVAVANSLAASAAYWIATAADELVVTPGGEVGSIGVFAAHVDESEWYRSQGIKPTLISAGRYKVEGNPYEPLGDAAREAIQERVDAYYDMFVRAVARNRGVGVQAVRGGFGEGRVVGAKRAVELGMADRVGTLVETVAQLARRPLGTLGRTAGLFAGPIAPHKSPGIADTDTPWDGPGEVAKADQAELHLMCAWFDSSAADDDGDGYPDEKGAYKLPHHRAGDHYLVPKGLYGCAQRLDQTDIPGRDQAGVRRHLARHYDELGETAPWESAMEMRRRRLMLG